MSGNAPIQALNRAAQILFSVAGAEGGRTIAQISRATGLNPHTAYRLARTLEGDNLLARDGGDGRFRLGSLVADLVRIENERSLLAIASRVLVRTQLSLTDANFSLVDPLPGGGSCARLIVAAERPGHAALQRTVLHPPYAKASSLLFLAYASAEEREAFFRRNPFEPAGVALWESRLRLESFLSDTRRRGYSLPEFPDGDYYRVAAPVFRRGHAPIAAVGAYVPNAIPDPVKDSLVKLCRAAAGEIDRSLS